jgi:chemotaxis protein methyltransferase CheR
VSGGDAAAIEQLAALVRERTGNLISPARLAFLGEIAERRTRAAGLGRTADYVRALAAGELPAEWQRLVPLLTIKESYFFRAPQQFEAIERQVLPRLLRARAASRRLRIWSAACARGEEPATLAIVLAEVPELTGWDWRILATDLDEEALAGARRGLYGERAVSQVPPPLLERHFIRRGKLFELAPALRARIDYRFLNLAGPPHPRPGEPDAEHDLVLLRNVLIYFPRDLQARVMTHVARSLSRRGTLFLGASETLWQIQDELEAVDLGTCYAYRHRRSGPAAAGEPELRTLQADPGRGLPEAPPIAAERGGRQAAAGTGRPVIAAMPPAPLGTGLAAPAAPPAPGDGPPHQRSAAELLLGAAHALAANLLSGAARRSTRRSPPAPPSRRRTPSTASCTTWPAAPRRLPPPTAPPSTWTPPCSSPASCSPTACCASAAASAPVTSSARSWRPSKPAASARSRSSTSCRCPTASAPCAAAARRSRAVDRLSGGPARGRARIGRDQAGVARPRGAAGAWAFAPLRYSK